MIHNIANQQLASLTNCESEPIHVPGSIQPFGFLLAVRPGGFTVAFCSANVADYLNVMPAELLAKPLSTIFSDSQLEDLKQYLFSEDFDAAHPLQIQLGDAPFNMHAGRKGDLLLLEFEPRPETQLTLTQLYGQMKRFAAATESAQTLKGLCALVAAETRAITGFDRVMIYRFDKDYNGEVIAESRIESAEPFLNLHYPHTDIPQQARQLYMQNLVRLIADVSYEPVPILTMSTLADHKSVDLSHAILRSVSPIHIEYLKNMGVAASFSVSLMHEGRLWGLIACHHYSPRVLPYHIRLGAQLQGHFLTSQIRVQEAKNNWERTKTADLHLHKLQQLLLRSGQSIPEFYGNEHLLWLVNATGVLAVYDGKYHTSGAVPDEEALIQLVAWLSAHTTTGSLHTDRLIDVYPAATTLGTAASGILYHSLGIAEHNCIIWFRQEVARTIEWAGNPSEAIREVAAGVRLSPRKSFAAWQEDVRNTSEAWTGAELTAAASLAYALEKQLHLAALARDEARYRRLNEQLTEANEELSRINWISTHDLKEPLRKIQMFGSRILESEKDTLSNLVSNSVTRMRVAANRMQVLIDDILLYSKMNVKDDSAGPVALNTVLESLAVEFEDELIAGKAILETGDLPVVKGISAQFEQLFRNLLSNALKFARKEEPLVIKVQAAEVSSSSIPELKGDVPDKYYRVDFTDNGIGFDAAYGTRIFEVFQRLHTIEEYPGSGIGLAICRKIMQNHDGTITADGMPGNGASFHLFFPALY